MRAIAQAVADERVVALPRPHAGQKEVIAQARRFNVVVCG